MDVVTKVESWIANWSTEGESELRNFLISPHSNPSDPICAEALTTAYHALLLSALTTWQPKHSLNAQALVAFIQSVLLALPSSSSARAGPPVHNAVFGEILVDVLWSTDAQLDEFLADAKSALVGSEQASGGYQVKDTTKKDTTDGAVKASRLRYLVEQDKDTLSELVKRLLFTGIVDLAVCRERLDLSLLASAGLVSDRMSFDKKEIRTRTGLFYKQNKFNLLREQSEGYSKLSVELTSSLGPAHSHADARPVESYASIEDRARQVWEKVISLIGYFDLDPNRALDIILDVLSVNVATHYTFFLALLSFSPWTGLYRRPAMSTATRMAVDPVTELLGDKSLDEVLKITEANASDQSTPPLENDSGTESRVLAQVLGFKFSHYQSPEAHEPPPRNLYLTAAILIREGFITVEDLYPHLTPRDADIETYHKDYLAQVQQRISDAKISQLAMAAPLESSSSSSQPRVEPTEVKKSLEFKSPNQVAGLVNGLLSVGALRPAIAVLTRIPWLVDAHSDLADLMLRVLKYSIAPLYDATFVLKERNPSFTQPRARFSATGTLAVPIRKYQLSLIAPTPPSTASVDFVFFFPDWTQRIPLCTSFEDMVNVIEPLMSFIGLHVSRDALFVTKITRLGRSQLLSTIPLDPVSRKPLGEPDASHPVRQFWFKLLRLYFLPALPLIRGNAVCTVDIWNVIRQYETTARWRLYGEWKSSYISHPELRIRQVQADRESKGILRRLSHNTIETLSGTVAKLAHSNPCIFFTNAVNQIMAYDNLANVVIQALRYVTNMGFDVLVYVILEALSNPNKNRVKDDGVNTSDWLQSLASFTGMLFRRYSADLSPLLKYVVHQLYNGQTTEIVVLRELIWKMAGIEPLPSLSDPQIAAMAGGPALRIEAVASTTRGARLDPGDAVLKGPQRLGKTMLETNLALALLIQVAQQRQSCVFKAPDAHLKSLASLFDTTHGVLLQYLDLLTSPAVISPKDYATRILPSLADLGELYGIAPPICMQIIRPMLNATILSAAQEKERLANEEAEKRLKARLSAAKREPSAATPRVDSPTGVNGANTPRDTGDQKPSADGVPEDAAMDVEATTSATPAPSESPWIPDLEALFDDVKQIAKNSALDVIGPGFYLTFWQLSMYDLAPPAARYDEECAALRTLSRQEDSKYIAADRSADRTKRLSAGSHRAKRDRYNAFVNTLAQEFKEQTASRVFTMKRLAREKHHWFAHTEHRSSVLASAIIEHCIQPRCLLSPMDSDFCAQFIKVMHTQGTPGFPTLVVYDKLLGDHVKAVVFSCSEYEAKNYGRFLLGILTDLWKWAQDEQLFLMENRTKVGGKTILLPGFQHRWSSKDHGSIVADDLLSWTGFKQILRKWHRKLGRSLLSCIETTEFMHVYNAIIVLKEILPVFPLAAVGDAGPAIDSVMEKFLEKEERGDLKILGRAYSASLKKREPFWAVPKSLAAKSNGDPMSPKPANSAGILPEKQARTPIPLNGAATPVADRTSTPVPTLLRANGAASQAVVDRPTTPATSTSIPRPEKVRRIRPEKGSESPAPDGDAKGVAKSDSMDVDTPLNEQKSTHVSIPDHILRPTPRLHQGSSQNALPSTPATMAKDASRLQRPPSSSSAPNTWESPHSPRPRSDEKQTQPSSSEAMPPPSAPSQTLSAQELRETAKQSIGNRPPDRADDKRSQPGSGAPSPNPRRRTPSPPPRPGTRTHSMESRASGRRSDRGSGDGDRPDDRPSDREARLEPRAPTGRKDAATHPRSDRGTRERTSTRDSDRDRESERDRDSRRDRHAERDRDRDREKERDRDRERDRERDRDKDKDKDKDRDRRDRDRERDRDRDRDRDRHRRDEKDRDRDSRKDRETSGRGPTSTAVATALDTRNLPTRPDPTRHSSRTQVGDDGLGKRRRPTDDEADRNTKRSSRKEGHREDRTRRSEKESHDRLRESDRRREREAPEAEVRHPISDRPGEKRLPEGPKNLPPSTPSAPRAMASGDASRAKPDIPTSRSGGDWKSQRDHGSHTFPASTSGGLNQDVAPSLRSRIGDKEPPRTAPQAPYRSEVPHKDDDRDNRKRTLADRDKDVGEATISAAGELSLQPPKRPRINRNRYNPHALQAHGLAKRTLPIDPQAGDKSRSTR
ncbi:transcription factor/nuclear export subunit protein 2-domain-containing protein [Suillus clintonianus]|uniref:transcription factor/nuclear export subunit protein 2-domain-containing protein n=1 Tax=Suillus clintonianus TaxID=1904413 RepID=UPI001B877BE2|nr:transcription factor/nuclear export subunit protein 2-domain-containing protein [Suillus clintonianus]KAG2148090.1 transcription factor/nuclear export subunit protein 2-domain-containing protein [Suillus clintonianus]